MVAHQLRIVPHVHRELPLTAQQAARVWGKTALVCPVNLNRGGLNGNIIADCSIGGGVVGIGVDASNRSAEIALAYRGSDGGEKRCLSLDPAYQRRANRQRPQSPLDAHDCLSA